MYTRIELTEDIRIRQRIRLERGYVPAEEATPQATNLSAARVYSPKLIMLSIITPRYFALILDSVILESPIRIEKIIWICVLLRTMPCWVPIRNRGLSSTRYLLALPAKPGLCLLDVIRGNARDNVVTVAKKAMSFLRRLAYNTFQLSGPKILTLQQSTLLQVQS